MAVGKGRGRGEHSCGVDPILEQTSVAEVETEGEASGEAFLHVVVEVGAVVDLD